MSARQGYLAGSVPSEIWHACRLPMTRGTPCRAGFYMHPAMADCTLHLSLVPNSGTTQPLEIKIPVLLGALAVPGRRDGLLRAPWAAATSDPAPGAAGITGDMTLRAGPHARDGAPICFHFVTLISRPASTGDSSHKSWGSAASQVLTNRVCIARLLSACWKWHHRYQCLEAFQLHGVAHGLPLYMNPDCVLCRARASSTWSHGFAMCQRAT